MEKPYTMNSFLRNLMVFLLLVLGTSSMVGKRTFIHPGISYTQADLDRMRAMVAAKQEPYYSTYLKMKADGFSSRGGRTGLTRINEGQFNGIIGVDGRAALQQALIWKIEGDATYANRAVAILNGYKDLVSASSRGTGPLDNGKIYMLIDAAELMRDYSGWSSADQKAFKDMLVHPGYSTKVIPSSHYSLDDAVNDVSFYWNIFNGDSGRHGNQGLFAFRGLMAMGIFMDNDTIYDRAYRKFMSLPHRSDDLSYPSGPPVINYTVGTYSTYEEYSLGARQNTTTDYGYDDELKYYIYENGQCQESFRDQAHTMGGITNCFDLAKMAWNQGDNMFDAYDGRILKGLEWNTRFNLGYRYANRWPNEELFNPTIANGRFLSRLTRCKRWKGLAMATGDRGAECGERVRMLMQYKIRMGLPADSIKWIQRAYDVMMDSVGYEIGYVAPNWYYEQNGWGHLLSYRGVWQAGDPGRFENRMHVSGTPSVPTATLKAVDYDFYNNAVSGQNHTFKNNTFVRSTLYRTDGTVEIEAGNGGYVVTNMETGEWMNYTVNCTQAGRYTVSAVYLASESAALGVAANDGTMETGTLPATTGYQQAAIGDVQLNIGTNVVRLYVTGKSNVMKMSELKFAKSTNLPSYTFVPTDFSALAGTGSIHTDSSKIISESLVSSKVTVQLNPTQYRITNDHCYLVLHGRNLGEPIFSGCTHSDNQTFARSNKPAWSFNIGNDDKGQIYVWKADSTTSAVWKANLSEAYANGDAFTLNSLTFILRANLSNLNLSVDDLSFYTKQEMVNKYTDLASTFVSTNLLNTRTIRSGIQKVYDLKGNLLRSKPSDSTQNILEGLQKGIYIVNGEKVLI